MESSERESLLTPRNPSYSVEEALDKMGGGLFQLNVFVYSGSLRAYHALVDLQLALLIPSWRCEFSLSNTQLAILTAMFPLGNMVGINPLGYLCDRYGRKRVVNLANIFLILFSLLSAFAPSYTWLVIIRFVLGAIDVATAMCTTYCVEFMSARWRAGAVVLLSLFWTFGTCLLVGISFLSIPTVGWRYLVLIISGILCIAPVHNLCVPTSPRYLVEKGRIEEARKVLELGAKLNCRSLPEGDLSTNDQNIQNNTQQQQQTRKEGIKEIILGKKYRLTTLILSLIWFTCGFLGYGAVLITSDIFIYDNHCIRHNSNTSVSTCSPLTSQDYFNYLVTTLAEIPGVLVTIFLVEFIGRKKTFSLLFTSSGIGFCLLFICFPYEHTLKTVLLFIIRGTNAGAFNLAFLYTGEVYNTTIRARSISILSTFSRIATILTGFVSQILLREHFLYAIGLFGGVALVTGVASIVLPYETKGKRID